MTFDIRLLEPKEVSLNLRLFKLFRFFHLFDPKTRKFYHFNVYHLVWYFINFVIGSIVIYGLSGYFTEMEDVIDIVFNLQLMFCCLIYSLSLLKIITFIYKANYIWDLLRVTHLNFLTSIQCQTHIGILHKYREKSIKITNYLSVFAITITIQWCLYPLVLLLLQKEDANQSNRRFENIFNFRFPVTISYYNNNYVIFYITETSFEMFLLYVYVVIDIFFISICYIMIAHYEMIKKAYEGVNSECNSENNNENKNYYNMNDCFDDLVLILMDQQKHFVKLKLFYSTYKFIILSTVIINSGSIIILTYASVVIFTSSESIPILGVIKLISAFGYLLIILFFLCNLLESIHNKMESVHFGMYSCNWTSMNLRSKKMLLLSMKMNNANRFMIKLTPRKIVNLQLFNSVLITCYNVLSAMLNTLSK
ncbi:uncharacterized protein LOC113555223 [Rhopalosiphum maidis]|uniref:uncharacterized protein LOC113555223 n=1 Tax=Rhopalosiphum maidis TaxID=43146 RepID=UPI000EFDBBBA|nr:uncharacterized protein LOC113555223 [Rhopalosiphum maidis]